MSSPNSRRTSLVPSLSDTKADDGEAGIGRRSSSLIPDADLSSSGCRTEHRGTARRSSCGSVDLFALDGRCEEVVPVISATVPVIEKMETKNEDENFGRGRLESSEARTGSSHEVQDIRHHRNVDDQIGLNLSWEEQEVFKGPEQRIENMSVQSDSDTKSYDHSAQTVEKSCEPINEKFFSTVTKDEVYVVDKEESVKDQHPAMTEEEHRMALGDINGEECTSSQHSERPLLNQRLRRASLIPRIFQDACGGASESLINPALFNLGLVDTNMGSIDKDNSTPDKVNDIDIEEKHAGNNLFRIVEI